MNERWSDKYLNNTAKGTEVIAIGCMTLVPVLVVVVYLLSKIF